MVTQPVVVSGHGDGCSAVRRVSVARPFLNSNCLQGEALSGDRRCGRASAARALYRRQPGRADRRALVVKAEDSEWQVLRNKSQYCSAYHLVEKLGEGTFSEVFKWRCEDRGTQVAVKCMKDMYQTMDEVQQLEEIKALKRLTPHPTIVDLLEVLYDQPTGKLALVFECMDMNAYELVEILRARQTYIPEDRLKSYMYQFIKGVDHMHSNGVFHRDIKPENILITDGTLKLADFGWCRGIYSKPPYVEEYISSRWYRAPECLLTDGYYNYKMDMWGVGCVFFEMVSLFPLFPGNDEVEQVRMIHSVLGTPPDDLLEKIKKRSQHFPPDFKFDYEPGTGIAELLVKAQASPECVDLINRLLAYNPDDRLCAHQALKHPYFAELRAKEEWEQALTETDKVGGPASRWAAPEEWAPEEVGQHAQTRQLWPVMASNICDADPLWFSKRYHSEALDYDNVVGL